MKVNEHRQETKFGGGEDGMIHTLLLHDLHGEYTGDFDKRPENFNGYGETDLWWRTSAIQDSLQEIFDYSASVAEIQATRLMPAMLPIHFLEREGDNIEWVWRVTGSREYLEIKFDELAKTLTVDEVSGDDDAFDYWPNTMDMLWDFASDLDDIDGTLDHCGRVWEVARKVFEDTVAKRTGTRDEQEYRELFISEWGLDMPDSKRGWNGWYQDVG